MNHKFVLSLEWPGSRSWSIHSNVPRLHTVGSLESLTERALSSWLARVNPLNRLAVIYRLLRKLGINRCLLFLLETVSVNFSATVRLIHTLIAFGKVDVTPRLSIE